MAEERIKSSKNTEWIESGVLDKSRDSVRLTHNYLGLRGLKNFCYAIFCALQKKNSILFRRALRAQRPLWWTFGNLECTSSLEWGLLYMLSFTQQRCFGIWCGARQAQVHSDAACGPRAPQCDSYLYASLIEILARFQKRIRFQKNNSDTQLKSW